MMRHWRDALALFAPTIPGLISSAARRCLFKKMRIFTRELPDLFDGSIPEALEQLISDLEPACPICENETTIRNLADLAVMLDRQVEIGSCLRRSLTRFYFLRQAGVPVILHFGARHTGEKQVDLLEGHAWLTHLGEPYHELHESIESYTVMLSFPENETNPARFG